MITDEFRQVVEAIKQLAVRVRGLEAKPYAYRVEDLMDTEFTALADEDFVWYDAPTATWVNINMGSIGDSIIDAILTDDDCNILFDDDCNILTGDF